VKLEDFQVYNLSMELGEEIHTIVKDWNYFEKDTIGKQLVRSEELGTGLRNVFKYSKAYSGSEKVIFLEEDIFMVSVPLVSDVTENVTENRLEQILVQLKNNPTISFDELSKQLHVARMTIYRDIEKLKNKRQIKRMGPDKGGYWKIIANE